MKYLIIGDSWGCGEWGKDFHTGKKPHDDVTKSIWQPSNEPDTWHRSYVISNTHVGYYLEDYGHISTNLSKGGDSNLNQLKLCHQHLESNSDYDQIVWFLSEPVRDWDHNFNLGDEYYEKVSLPDGYDKIVEAWFALTFLEAEFIYERHNIPWIVIGGMTPVPELIKNFSFCHTYIEDWTNEMITEKFCYHPFNAGNFRQFGEKYVEIFHNDRFMKESQDSLNWIQHCFMSKRFPDWGHPDREAHRDLARWINNVG